MVAYICGDPSVSASILLGLYLLRETAPPPHSGWSFVDPRLGTNHTHTPVFTETSFIQREGKVKSGCFLAQVEKQQQMTLQVRLLREKGEACVRKG